MAVLKVWPCVESKLEFETKTLNAKCRGLGYSALQCLYSPLKPKIIENCAFSNLMVITEPINEIDFLYSQLKGKGLNFKL